MENPKVKFLVLSHEKLAKEVYFYVRNLRENYKKNLYIEIPNDVFQSILNNEFKDIKDRVIELVKKYNNIIQLEEYSKRLEEYWKPLDNLFFENLKKITGFNSPYQEYEVYTTKIIRGCYSSTNTIFTNFTKEIKVSGFIVAEELLHIYYWNIFKKLIKNVESPWKISREIWEISEIIPEYILTDKSFKDFGWPENLNRNYPFIGEWKQKLNSVWDNKENFRDFLIKIHKNLVKEIP